jgi:hypothetical protein
LGGVSISHTNGYIAGDFHEDGRLLSFRNLFLNTLSAAIVGKRSNSSVKRTALFREEVGRTVSDSAEIDEEIHALCEALVASKGRLSR